MGFKQFFIVDEESEKKKGKNTVSQTTTATAEKTTFPTRSNSSKAPQPNTQQNTFTGRNCEPYMDQVMELYEKGFEGLNKPGIDFFEYYKAVINSGIDNPQAYVMAFNMLSGLDNSISKNFLVNEAQDYLNEIDKVHRDYRETGQNKKMQLENERDSERNKLTSDIELLKEQVDALNKQIGTKEVNLNQLDQKYNPQLEEVECKLEANDFARNAIKDKIQKVTSGITSNLK